MEQTIQIKKMEVYKRIASITNYHGAAILQNTGKLNKLVFTSDNDAPILFEHFWREACGEASSACKMYLKDFNILPTDDGSESESESESEESEEINVTETDNIIDIRDVLTITLGMPGTFDTTFLLRARSSLFDYIVYHIVSSWFAVNEPDLAALYIAKGEAAKDNFVSFLHRRITLGRRPLYPF